MTTRRQIIRVAAGSMTLIVGGLHIACTPRQSVRIDSAQLSDEELLTLVRISQHILPHQSLATDVYRDAMLKLADAINGRSNQRQLVRDGIAELNAESDWLGAPRHRQIEILRRMQNTPFFALLRTVTLENVYRDERGWQAVGYEGEAIRFGGYLDRGFNDIDWLPSDPTTDQVD